MADVIEVMRSSKQLRYTNFTLRLYDNMGDHFRAEVVDSPVGRMRKADWVPYRFEIEPLLWKLWEPRMFGELKDRELEEMGQYLGDMLLPPTVRGMFFRSWEVLWGGDVKSGRGLRVLLVIDDEVLATLDAFEARLEIGWERLQQYLQGLVVSG